LLHIWLGGKTRGGRISAGIFDRRATKPGGQLRENPSGGGSFGRGLCWLGPYSPLRGCADLAALASAKIPRRSTPQYFQTGSNRRSRWFQIALHPERYANPSRLSVIRWLNLVGAALILCAVVVVAYEIGLTIARAK